MEIALHDQGEPRYKCRGQLQMLFQALDDTLEIYVLDNKIVSQDPQDDQTPTLSTS